MMQKNLEPGKHGLAFMMSDALIESNNKFYIRQDKNDNAIELKIKQIPEEGKDKQTGVKLHSNKQGNCSPNNYTVAWVLPLYVLDTTKVNDIKVMSAGDINWSSYIEIKNEDKECILYLLAEKDKGTGIAINEDGISISVRNVPVASGKSKVCTQNLMYRTMKEPGVDYVLKSWMDIYDHTGISTPPFQLMNDTPIVPINTEKNQTITLRLLNITNAPLDLSTLSLQLLFDVYENQIKSPGALVDKTTLDNPGFSIKLLYGGSVIGNFEKITAAEETIFKGIYEWNPKGEKTEALSSVNNLDSLSIEINLNKVYESPGNSPIQLQFFNVHGYWNGQLEIEIKRTAYFEDLSTTSIERDLQNLHVNSHIMTKVSETNTPKYIDVVPVGTIVMWSGSKYNIPHGWALCNGGNNTPNLTDRFVVGSGYYYPPNETGGSNYIQLGEEHLPSHTHSGTTDKDGSHSHISRLEQHNIYQWWRSFKGVGNENSDSKTMFYKNGDLSYDEYHVLPDVHTYNDDSISPHSHSFTTESAGGGNKFDNRPPYYALAFIMKLDYA